MVSVQRVFERLAGTELGNLGGLDFNRVAGARIAAGAGGALADCKSAETDERHGTALLERGTNGADRGFECPRGSGFGDVGVLCDVLNQFGFVHKGPLQKIVDQGRQKRRQPRGDATGVGTAGGWQLSRAGSAL